MGDLERRISEIPLERFRNFCIVAHVDHGKSTLSDRLLELTGTIAPGGNQQFLDKLDVERERGITVKAQTCSMIYKHRGDDYLLHLVDTPGHVDFRAEVSRSYASCGGALLLVDASQGVQAQTVANFYLAFAQGLHLVPIINKVDLPSADSARALEQMKEAFELDPSKAVLVSAKTGFNVKAILPTVVDQIPAPVGDHLKPLKLLLVDSWYSNYKGVILLVRIFDGQVKAGDHITSFVTGLRYIVGEVGIMYPDQTRQTLLRAGQVGYIYFNPGMKRSQEAKVGDTYTTVGAEKMVEPLPGFEEPKAMVFVAAFPVDQSDYAHLEDSINQITLNDRSVTLQKESSEALGAGWRLGFLGTLHCSVFEDRLRQEHGASIIITPPTVPFKVIWKDGKEGTVTNPAEFPDGGTAHAGIAELQEPYVLATIALPQEYLGKVIELCEGNRGEQKELQFFTATQVILKYDLPLAHLVDDFFGKLKSLTKGYASLDYEESAWRKSSIIKLQLLVNKEPVDAVARVVHYSQAERLGRQWVTKFKQHVDRQMFEVVIQAVAGKRVVARETIKPFRKDVLSKLHASDISRRRKLLERQKEGRKKLRAVGNVAIENKAFHKFLANAHGSLRYPPQFRRPVASVNLPQFAAAMDVKEQVVDTLPKRIKELKFGLPKHGRCETCGETLLQCNGHFGVIKLVLPAFHIGYFKFTMTICQNICKDCARILLPESERRKFLRSLRRPNLDNFQRLTMCKKINDECKKTKNCYACGAINGQVKKGGPHPLKLLHDRFSAFKKSKALSKEAPRSKIEFEESFSKVKDALYGDVNRHLHKAVDDLNPLRVLNLFRQITSSDVELLGMNAAEGRPENLLWQCVPAPPVCIRPSVSNDTSSTEDDLTQKIADIANINNLLKEGLKNGLPIQTIMEQWEYMQTLIALYINSDQPGLLSMGNAQHIRGLCQRLKGKQGRFRGNLSGKRVDFSGRTVISPDPNLAINEVAIPVQVAKRMTYPEKVSRYNKAKLQQRVLNGVDKWPGANYIFKPKHNVRTYLKYGKLSGHAENLLIGDIVERHLEDGDIVLFNRQPSLHKLSILSHFVRVRPYRTFSLNECVCNPYNADFDGDEMNLHVPQTEEARAEAVELMGVKHNLSTPKNGEPIISAIQDFITAAYLLSSKDVFYDRKTFAHICMYMVDGSMQLDLPPPTVLKPTMLWTGKQVFNVMMRPNKHSPVRVNLDAACREYRRVEGQPRDLDRNDGWLCIRNSEIMCGVMDKSTIGSGKKDSIFYVILRDYGPDAAVQAMNRMAKLSARWLTNQGFSIGISDVYPGGKLTDLKRQLVEAAYAQCDKVIEDFKKGRLEKAAGCDEEATMENSISGILSKVRQEAGNACITELSRWNSPLIMATSGSKGSNINVSQMVAVVGQQIIGGKRVADGFEDRSLPHFAKNARHPPSKGFVRNSFFSGLHPTEFLFHAISGREGLVDTAVKTAETGYMSRRLMKSLEDLSTQYDDTVRNGSSHIVQFQYGDDKLDPVDMEARAKPVHFDRTYTHAESTTWDNNARTLLPYEIIAVCKDALLQDCGRLLRQALANDQNGEMNHDSKDRTMDAVDELDSVRDYLNTVERFIHQKAQHVAAARRKLGLTEGWTPNENGGLKGIKAKAANNALDCMAKVPEATLRTFVHACLQKFEKAQTEPGHAVGAVAAQSIGEPGTQMTLKTFHFAGVAGMTITQGVPRIKEIINASKEIQTPVITCELLQQSDVRAARIVKGRIEKTYLKDIASYIDVTWHSTQGCIAIKIDLGTISKLQLDLSVNNIRLAILKHRKLKLKPHNVTIYHSVISIDIHPAAKASKTKSVAVKENPETFLRMEQIRRLLPDVPLSGYERASRAIIKTENDRNSLLVEGYGLRACMSTDGVKGTATRTNSIMEMKDVLGIEAARKAIIDEISIVMGDMDIDPRHMQLLADVMTYKGEILGITRFGMAKMRDSVLQLASFEKTPDHLFEAAWLMKRDRIEGVSECIIMGQSIGLGTGAFKVVREMGLKEGELGSKATLFEDAWKEGGDTSGDTTAQR
ncbi:MAG: hypothetical protein LQ345_001290 [Seirophora villosa]|nr:MAG: hypothetical protein LQ345_001290 [Seirophora villosa]